MSDEEPGGDYVRRVYDGSRRFTQDLLAENERLRALVAGLQNDKLRLQDESRAALDELQRLRAERDRVARSLEAVEAENRDYSARYVEVETHNCNLMNLHVAMLRLHGTLHQDEVVEVAKDIIVNVLGSEELGVFLLEPGARELRLASSLGLDAEAWARVPLERGLLGRTAVTGRAFLPRPGEAAERGVGEEWLTACVPLTRVGDVVGVIAIFRLLCHKPELQAFDHDLLGLLGTQVGMALYATRLRPETQAGR